MKTRITTALLVILFSATASRADLIPITESHWELSESGAEITEFKGRTAIKLNRGQAVLKDITLKNGIIEFDVWMAEKRSFGGVLFRATDKKAENFYLRPHLSGMPDANQYMPIFNGNGSWQIFHGNRYSAPTNYNFGEWIKVKLIIKNDKMDIYLDSDKPVLHVSDLLADAESGSIRFNGSLQDFYFSNINVTATNDAETTGEGPALKDLPANLIKAFNVSSSAIDSTSVEGKMTIDPALLSAQHWVRLQVGETGAANLSEVARRESKKDTLLVRMKIAADEAQTMVIKYGFSDRVTIFLNGKAVAYDDDTYMSRDYRYLGTVGLFDSVYLPLKQGENDVVFAVAEAFGGWAFLAEAETKAGVTIN